MQGTLEEIEQCKGELQLPAGALDTLTVFPRAQLLLQSLQELQEWTQRQGTLQEVHHGVFCVIKQKRIAHPL
jgi:hypothetical protein